ncbi:MAG: hypothetical protein L7F77_11180 [Candidatus Magnetominusculus sp. LBB02]|nr:hypothetical protein [Candidatus Magnetominusculus sp. LBB02]
MFTTSGGPGFSPGINEKPPIYAIPLGQSLAETLRLSWQSVLELGTPAWDKPDLQLPKNGNVPLLTGITWLPRQVWLDEPEKYEATCISCGRIEPLIINCEFSGIGTQKDKAIEWIDSHVIYEMNNNNEDKSLRSTVEQRQNKVDVLSTPDVAAGRWTKVTEGILKKNTKHGYTVDKCAMWVIDFATVKNAKYLEAKESVIQLHSSQQTQDAIEKIALWQKKGNTLAGKEDPIEIRSIVASIRPHVETTVSANIGELLETGGDAWEITASQYKPMMDVIAKSLSPGFTTEEVRQRMQIASAAPDMGIKATKKPCKKRGGHK